MNFRHISLCISLLFVLTSACKADPRIDERIVTRTYPSIFQAWNQAQNLNAGPTGPSTPLSEIEDDDTTIARHDLLFTGWPSLGLRSDQRFCGLVDSFTSESIAVALKRRHKLLALNPHLVLLAEVRYYDAWSGYLPDNSTWWKLTPDGQHAPGWQEGGFSLLDFSNPDFQDAIARQSAALVKSGVFDGVMLDWWNKEDPARLSLIVKVRAAVGNNAIILVNTNDTRPVLSAPFINGVFMEGYGTSWFGPWKQAAQNMLWDQSNLREPRIVAFEGWFKNSRSDYALMRDVTTMSLVFSDGYVLFGDPDPLPTPDHLHDVYPFWDKTLGRPAAAEKPGPVGSFTREFTNGTVLFNPPDNAAVTIDFQEARKSAATGIVAKEFTVAAGDGDLFLKTAH